MLYITGHATRGFSLVLRYRLNGFFEAYIVSGQSRPSSTQKYRHSVCDTYMHLSLIKHRCACHSQFDKDVLLLQMNILYWSQHKYRFVEIKIAVTCLRLLSNVMICANFSSGASISQCGSSGIPVYLWLQWSSSVFQLCKLTLDRHWNTTGC